MPVFNGGPHLRPAVLSILAQSFTDWRLLILDDGSTDDSLGSIADIEDPRIDILVDGENRGLAARLNQAIDLADSELFARMDQDDIAYPERFAEQVERLEHEPELDLVAVRAVTIDEHNIVRGYRAAPLTHASICAHPWLGFYLPHPTWMGRIGWFRHHRYATPGPYFCEDQELLLRSYRDSRFATVDKILFAYRVRSTPNWAKLRRTRRTLMQLQWQFFAANREPLNAALTLGGYAVRSMADTLRWLGQFLPSGGVPPPPQLLATEQARFDRCIAENRLALPATDRR